MKKFQVLLYVTSIVVAIGIGMLHIGKTGYSHGALPPCDENATKQSCETGMEFGNCDSKIFKQSGEGTSKYGPSGSMLCQESNCKPEEGITAIDCGG